MEGMTGVFPPYLPSTLWCRSGEFTEAARRGRFLTRTRIRSNDPDGLVLTVPIIGGSGAVKRKDPHGFLISGHGDWTRIHLGAIEAAYGREPYFQHFFPEIAGIIAGYPPLLETLNRSLLATVLRLAGYNEEIEGIRSLREKRPERFGAIEKRLLAGVDPEHSVIEPLFRYGRDILLLLSRPPLSFSTY